jgi:hypothetical protein
MGELAAHDPCWHSNRRALGLCGRTLLLRVVMNIQPQLIPLMPSGKIDRNKLPVPAVTESRPDRRTRLSFNRE